MIARRPWSLAAELAMVAGLAAVVAIRWWWHAVALVPINDEIPYMRAVGFVLDGASPYSYGHYLYPPLLAVVGAAAVERVGEAAFLISLRALCYLGVATTVWLALRTVEWRKWFLPAAIAYLCLAPVVWFGVVIHNISLLVSGSTLLALWIWTRRPGVAGVLLGVGAILKPMVFPVPFLLLLHRPRSGGHNHQIAGAVGIVTAALLLWWPPYLQEMLDLASRPLTIPRSVSLHRLTYLAGWESGTLWVSVAIGLLALGWMFTRKFSRGEFMVVAVTASLMATPVLWSHSLVMTLPIQVLALDRLIRRRREGRLSQRFEPVFVFLVIAALQLSAGASGIDDQPVWLQVLGTLPIALAPLMAAIYVIRTGAGGARSLETDESTFLSSI